MSCFPIVSFLYIYIKIIYHIFRNFQFGFVVDISEWGNTISNIENIPSPSK